MIKELVLKKPIMAHNEKLHVLELREPSYDEIEAIGFPFTVSGDGGDIRFSGAGVGGCPYQ